MLQAANNDVNLGEVKMEKEYKFKYIVTNISQKAVQINKLTLSCGSCTKASTDKTLLAPNQSTVVSIVFTPNSTGINKKRISIDYTTGTAHSDPYILSFSATVKQ